MRDQYNGEHADALGLGGCHWHWGFGAALGIEGAPGLSTLTYNSDGGRARRHKCVAVVVT